MAKLNWKAVAAGTAAHYALGGIWFAKPAFGARWQRAVGFAPPPGHRPRPADYLGPLAGSLLGSAATAALAERTGTRNLAEGTSLGLLVGAGYGAGLSATYAVSPRHPHPGELSAITAAYQVVGFSLVGAILGAWR